MAPSTLVCALALLLVIANRSDAKAKKASDYFSLCKRSDPDLPGCIKRSIEGAKPQIIKGIPEIKLPAIDPLFIPAMELREGQGNFLFVLKMKNLTIRGLKDFTVENVKVNLAEGTWLLDMKTPHLHFDAEYEMQGKILTLPIQGKGLSTFDFDGVSTICDVKHKNFTRNGKTHSQVDSLKWTIDVQGAKSNFTNLFNGEKTLGDTTNKFLNENWRDAFSTYKHLPEEAFAQFFTELENRFFDQFPLDELYPE